MAGAGHATVPAQNVAIYLAAKAVALTAAYLWLDRPDDFIGRLSTEWDGAHFLERARTGYPTGDASAWAFAPLFPWLIAAAGAKMLSPWIVAGVAGAGAVWAVTAWKGRRAGFALALFPTWLATTSFGYSEAVFVLLAAGALWCLDILGDGHGGTARRLALVAGLLASAAFLSRYVSALAWATATAFLLGQGRRYAFGFGLVLAAAGSAVLLWHTLATGSATTYLEAQAQWGSRPSWPWQWATEVVAGPVSNNPAVIDQTPPMLRLAWSLVAGLVAAVGLTVLWRHGEHMLVAFTLPLVIIPFITSGVAALSTPRLLLAGFPAIMALGYLLPPRIMPVYAVLGTGATAGIVVVHLTDFFA